MSKQSLPINLTENSLRTRNISSDFPSICDLILAGKYGKNQKAAKISVYPNVLKDTFFSLYEKGGLHNHLQ